MVELLLLKKENEPPRFFPLTKFKVSMEFKVEDFA